MRLLVIHETVTSWYFVENNIYIIEEMNRCAGETEIQGSSSENQWIKSKLVMC